MYIDQYKTRILDQKQRAHELINEYFVDKVDKGGQPYSGHLFRVANAILEEKYLMCPNVCNEVSIFYDKVHIVGLLHDIVEDTEVTLEQLTQCRFEQDIIDAIDAITRRKNEAYYDFIIRVGKNTIAKIVKLYDLKDNMDITRLNEFGEYEQKRLRKYFYSYRYLTEKISEEEYINKLK